MKIKTVFFDIGDTLVSKREWLPGVKELLRGLRDSKMKLGLISNTGRLDRDELEKLLPEDFDLGAFHQDLVLLSSEVGVEKPNLGIFTLAVQHSGNSPWETMFVGESLAEVVAAQRAGMQGARIVKAPEDFGILAKILMESE